MNKWDSVAVNIGAISNWNAFKNPRDAVVYRILRTLPKWTLYLANFGRKDSILTIFKHTTFESLKKLRDQFRKTNANIGNYTHFFEILTRPSLDNSGLEKMRKRMFYKNIFPGHWKTADRLKNVNCCSNGIYVFFSNREDCSHRRKQIINTPELGDST